MTKKKVLVVIPTLKEFEYFRTRTSQSKNPAQRTIHMPNPDFASGAIRLTMADKRSQCWLEIFIVCLGGQGKTVEALFRSYCEDINPHLVIVGGIAGGAAGHDLCICDIAVSDLVHAPNYSKAHPDRPRTNLRPMVGSLTEQIAATALLSVLRKELTSYARSELANPTDDELASAASNQGLHGEKHKQAVQLSRKHFDRIFQPTPEGGILVEITETYSEPTNQQSLHTAFSKSSELNPELGIAEMEAAIIWDQMKSARRSDGPLIVKCISDTPGLARSEPLKEMCRKLAAESLFTLLESPAFVRLLSARDAQTGVNQLALNSFTRRLGAERLRGLVGEGTLIRLATNPSHFTYQDIKHVAGLMSNSSALSTAMADVWAHFANVCWRCSRSAPDYLRLKPILSAALQTMTKSKGENIRAGKLAGVAPIFGVSTPDLDGVDWDSLISEIRGNPYCESKKTALMGRVYDLMSRDLPSTVDFIIRLKRSGEFHEQAISIWFFTAVAAAVSRGERLIDIRTRYSAWWEGYLDLYNERNPYSYDITFLLPLLAGDKSISESSEGSNRLDKLVKATDRGPIPNDIGLSEYIIARALIAKVDSRRTRSEQEHIMDVKSFTSIEYMPLAPVNLIRAGLKSDESEPKPTDSLTPPRRGPRISAQERFNY